MHQRGVYGAYYGVNNGLLRKNATCLRTVTFIYPSRIFPDAVGFSQHSLRSSISVPVLVQSLKPRFTLSHKARKAVRWP